MWTILLFLLSPRGLVSGLSSRSQRSCHIARLFWRAQHQDKFIFQAHDVNHNGSDDADDMITADRDHKSVVLEQQVLVKECADVAERLNLCITQPDTTWLTPDVLTSLEDDISEDSLINVVTAMICARDDVTSLLETTTTNDILESIVVPLQDQIETICSLASDCAGIAVATELRSILYGVTDDNDDALLLRLDQLQLSESEVGRLEEEEPRMNTDQSSNVVAEQTIDGGEDRPMIAKFEKRSEEVPGRATQVEAEASMQNEKEFLSVFGSADGYDPDVAPQEEVEDVVSVPGSSKISATRSCEQATCFLSLPTSSPRRKRRSRQLRRLFKRLLRPRSAQNTSAMVDPHEKELSCRFDYEFNRLEVIRSTGTEGNLSGSSGRTLGVVLIHPIGVGIAKWYYDRLLKELPDTLFSTSSSSRSEQNDLGYDRVVVLVPDLLASGTASEPTVVSSKSRGKGSRSVSNESNNPQQSAIPFLTVADWSQQVFQLMSSEESKTKSAQLKAETIEIDWCLVSNGGCVPIALEAASTIVGAQGGSISESNADDEIGEVEEAKNETSTARVRGRLTNIILSAPPRLTGLLRESNETASNSDTSMSKAKATDSRTKKVQTAYRRLTSSGIGRIFWWYALRNQGAFIQRFSERNLAADSANLGDDWTPNCVNTCRTYPQSRSSTFLFLAGALQQDCRFALDVLKNEEDSEAAVHIDVISGNDTRSNPARSWFWSRKRPRRQQKEAFGQEARDQKPSKDNDKPSPPPKRVSQFLKENGNRGLEYFVNGRRCLAHEDAPGFAKAMLYALSKK